MGLVEVIADRGVGAGGLDVRATSNVGNRSQNDPEQMLVAALTKVSEYILVECACEIKSSNNGLQLREARDHLEVGVVSDQETTSNGRERRE